MTFNLARLDTGRATIMEVLINTMYIRKVHIDNYGAIKSVNIDFQFYDSGNPKPVLLVGPNGSGKTLFLASIVNGLIEAINSLHHPDHQHQFMSPDYIRDSANYVWRQVEFTTDHFFSSLVLHSPKTSESSPPSDDETIQKVYDEIVEGGSSENIQDFNGVQPIFQKNCMLYLPVNRFEHPTWLIMDWELQKSQWIQMRDGSTIQDPKYSIIEYSSLEKNKQWKTSVLNNQIDVSPHIHKFVRHLDNEIASGTGLLEEKILSRSDDYLTDYFQLSSGEAMVANICFSILRRFGSHNRNTRISDISGIVMVDEIDLHLHTSYQYQNLPNLMKLFPGIQFIVTTHSPFFALGMEEVFGADGFDIYEFPSGCQISAEDFGEFRSAFQSMKRTDTFKKEIKDAQKPVVILEGETDIKYLLKAAEFLKKEDVIRKVELKCGEGFPGLDSIWKRWKDAPIRMILLYDCDCERNDETDSVVRRNIPKQDGHPVKKGIENLFSEETLNNAAQGVDKDKIEDLITRQGKHKGMLGKKVAICDWICENGRRTILSILRMYLAFWRMPFSSSKIRRMYK